MDPLLAFFLGQLCFFGSCIALGRAMYWFARWMEAKRK